MADTKDCLYFDVCGKQAYRQDKYCHMHRSRFHKRQDMLAPDWKRPKGTGNVTKRGYVRLYLPSHKNASELGYIFEHVVVMSEMLGRPLLPKENVHHKNGVKRDNRPENLELWVSRQPSGQRVQDLVAWAKEILETYE